MNLLDGEDPPAYEAEGCRELDPVCTSDKGRSERVRGRGMAMSGGEEGSTMTGGSSMLLSAGPGVLGGETSWPLTPSLPDGSRPNARNFVGFLVVLCRVEVECLSEDASLTLEGSEAAIDLERSRLCLLNSFGSFDVTVEFKLETV